MEQAGETDLFRADIYLKDEKQTIPPMKLVYKYFACLGLKEIAANVSHIAKGLYVI